MKLGVCMCVCVLAYAEDQNMHLPGQVRTFPFVGLKVLGLG